ncbi:MAG: hypothetical protein QXO37_06825 [Candidatus Nitrosocaldaceae archaeon]
MSEIVVDYGDGWKYIVSDTVVGFKIVCLNEPTLKLKRVEILLDGRILKIQAVSNDMIRFKYNLTEIEQKSLKEKFANAIKSNNKDDIMKLFVYIISTYTYL